MQSSCQDIPRADADPAPLPLRATSGTTSHSRTPSVQEARETSRPISRQTSKESYQPPVRQTGQHQLAKSAVREPSEDSDSEVDIPISNLSSRRLNPASTRYRASTITKSRQARKISSPDDEDEEDEDDSPFLPFANTASNAANSPGQHQDPSATLRGGFGLQNQVQRPTTQRKETSERIVTATSRPVTLPQILTSSGSSASSGPTPTTTRHRHTTSNPTTPSVQNRGPGPLSSQQAATLEAAGLSPRRRTGKEGSDGTPSMGSSFSDLDDASVTQSALEEALMSNMGKNGGNASVASRVSGLSQALRSRYFDAQGRQQ